MLARPQGYVGSQIAPGRSLAWAFEGRRVLLIETDLEQPEARGLTYRLGSVLLTYGGDGPQALELNRVIAHLEQSGAPLMGLIRTGATRRRPRKSCPSGFASSLR